MHLVNRLRRANRTHFTAEPIEDALSAPESVPAPDSFVAETEPVAEQIAPSSAADGGAFEDGPVGRGRRRRKPEDAQ